MTQESPIPYINTSYPRRNLHPSKLDADFSFYETVDMKEPVDKQGYRITSKGRCIQYAGRTDVPKVGDLYLLPTGIKGIFHLISCKLDTHKEYQHIYRTVKWIGGRVNEG